MISNFARVLLLAAFLIFANTSSADTLYGRVVGIADGDTVTVLDAAKTQWKIRLMGIDAPEKKQAFGNASKVYLSSLVFNKHVTVEYSKLDKYGRTVGKILVDGTDANLQQVKAGLAWHYKQYEKEQSLEDRTIYAQAEEQARTVRQGLWIDSDPIPPWDFRRGARGVSQVFKNNSNSTCPCVGEATCTGPKGGIYCLTEAGDKNYHRTRGVSQVLKKISGSTCPCSGEATCTGERGGIYCLTAAGNKNYHRTKFQ